MPGMPGRTSAPTLLEADHPTDWKNLLHPSPLRHESAGRFVPASPIQTGSLTRDAKPAASLSIL